MGLHVMGLQVHVARGSAAREAAFAVRRAVFIGEQGITEREEFDAFDEVALHFVASLDGRAVGTLRLRDGGEGRGKVERVAVLVAHRKDGVGRALLEAVGRVAPTLGYRELFLASQVGAVPFYERCGYVAEGEVFEQERIMHRWMRARLGE